MTFWKRSRSSETQKGPVVGEVIISFNFFLRSNLGRCNNRGTRLCLPKHKIRLSAICATSIVCSLIVDRLKLKMQKHDHIKHYEFIVALKTSPRKFKLCVIPFACSNVSDNSSGEGESPLIASS